MPCGKCGVIVDGATPWVVGHKKSRISYPHLIHDVGNWQPEHRACSDASGRAAALEHQRLHGAESVQNSLFDASGLRAVSSPGDRPSGQALLPVSLPATGVPIETRPELAWSTSAMLAHPWTAEFAEIPEDAAPPLYMSPVPADAVGSYGAEAIAWIENAERKTLRWWQRLAIVRQLEFKADGSLCHEQILESCPRRAGKSVRLRGVALWRMEHGMRLFGEVQTVIHTGNNIAICREVQRGAWRWARDVAGWEVSKANGKEALESLAEDRWMVKAQDAVYGYDVTLGLGDECWAVKPDTITEGLEPAMLERSSPQLHLTSTAHRRATSLMRGKILAALTGVDDDDLEDVDLLLIWAAPHGSDPADPKVWRAASPHWSEHRHRMIAKKYAKALKGEVDPAADDPDPMAGFVAQYLNVWPIHAPDKERGEPITTEHDWNLLAAPRPDEVPVAAAIESWFQAGVSLALAWRDGEQAVVAVTDHLDLVEAVQWLKNTGYRGRVVVGSSLVKDPAFTGMGVVAGQGRVGALAGELSRLISEDGVRHDGGEHASGQVLAVRTMESADGPRVVSTGRADGLKALVWAANAARIVRRTGPPRVLVGNS